MRRWHDARERKHRKCKGFEGKDINTNFPDGDIVVLIRKVSSSV